ncbi:MAG: hypothetical protein AB1551_05365 [Actinomycetota bacterium]
MRTSVDPRETRCGRARMVAIAAILGVLGALLAPTMAQAKPPVQAQRPFEAMTYNVYLGTDLSPLFAITNPGQVIPTRTSCPLAPNSVPDPGRSDDEYSSG